MADADRDGYVSAAEAVPFLRKSGLNNEVLAHVWALVDVGVQRGRLNANAFATAVRLVALAQMRPERLPTLEDLATVTRALSPHPPTHSQFLTRLHCPLSQSLMHHASRISRFPPPRPLHRQSLLLPNPQKPSRQRAR